MHLRYAFLALLSRRATGLGESGRDCLPRPTVVRIAVPYLAATWLAVSWVGGVRSISGDLQLVVVMTLWTIAWSAMLYRVWRGGPMAIEAVSLLVVGIAGAVVVIVGILPRVVAVLTYLTTKVLGYPMIDGWFGVPTAPAWWVAVVGNALAVVAGVELRRRDVWEWSASLHPPRGDADTTSNA